VIASVQNQKAVGTRSFWSVRLHQGAAQSYRDDLEALAYCLIWFLTGHLPWSAALDFNAMVQKKVKSSIEQICQNVPAEFQRFLQVWNGHRCPFLGQKRRVCSPLVLFCDHSLTAQICRELPYKLMPNYSNLRVMFRTLYARQNFTENAPWDWETYALADLRAQCGPLEFHMSEQVGWRTTVSPIYVVPDPSIDRFRHTHATV
jgi:hypothetical protein